MSQDIRAWAQEQGIELNGRGRLPKAVIAQYEAAHGGDEVDEEPLLIVPDGPEPSPEPPAEPLRPAAAERPPTPPKRRSLLDRKARPKDGKPPRRLPRVSVANLISSGWGLGAMALARNGNAIPVARVLQMQAPVAGVVVDDMVRGTAVDRLLQPLARAGERGEKAVALLGPPLITAAITARPELYPALRPMLKMSLMSWLTVSGPAMKKAQEQAARFSEDFGDVDLDGMIDALFTDVGVPVAHSADEDAAVKRARGE